MEAEVRRAREQAERARRLAKSIGNAEKTLGDLAAEYDRLVTALLEEESRQATRD